jgi:hypothetical protein
LPRSPHRIGGLAAKRVLAPDRVRADDLLVRPFDGDLEALARHATERAVRVHEVQRIEARVHQLHA